MAKGRERHLFFAVLSSASISLSFSFSSSLSCSFLLIFLYRWNSPDPAPLDRGSAHVLGWDLLLSTLLPSARLSGSHWSFGWLSPPSLVLDLRNQLCWSNHHRLASNVHLNPRKTTTNRKRYISRLCFLLSLNITPLRSYFTMQISTMSYNYHCDSYSICFAVTIEEGMPKK